MDKLWYKKPAENWNQALPIGNGRLGAMVFGQVDEDVYQLNEDTLWSGYPADTNNYSASAYFRPAAALALKRQYREAEDMIEEHMLGKWGQSYLPAGNLVIRSDVHECESYNRSLDLDTAVHTVRFTSGDVTFERETFVTAVDQVLCIRLKANSAGSLNFSVSLQGQLKAQAAAAGQLIQLCGQAPGDCVPSYIKVKEHLWYSDIDCEKGMTYCMMADVRQNGGCLRTGHEELSVSGADEAEIRLAINTSFNGFDKHPYLQGKNPVDLCRKQLADAAKFSHETLKARHIADYQHFFKRVTLDLGAGRDDLPTDERLQSFADDHADKGLAALLFQYGRYLLISSSRPGSQPANLQGIWNGELCAPWSSNYTTNINTEMNYWPALPCNLAECCEPLHRMMRELQITGRTTARAHYDAKGFCVHHNVDLWRLAAPVGNWGKGASGFAYFPLAGVWLTRHLWEYYAYTLDIGFLKNNAYGIIKDAVEFCDSMLSEAEDGTLLFCPATSPENTFYTDGQKCHVTAATTMAQSIVCDIFRIFIQASQALKQDLVYADFIRERLARLGGFKIGSQGQLLEWHEEFAEVEPHHRHVSHLYALHPADIINPEETPELAAACRKTLELRGDDGTGWSLAWKVNFQARLLDGDHALKLINRQLRLVDSASVNYQSGGTYPNLLDAHPPFQIDGNFGVSAGIAEMLIQSRPGHVHILPALPRQWPDGSFQGLCARNGLRADASWQNGKLRQATLYASQPVSVVLRCGSAAVPVNMPADSVVEFDSDLKQIHYEPAGSAVH
ncbi:MAG: glycoside hydrolase family 95 protein [Clostridiaceae bacterium]|nr:glycoside hydrolase family 95 protein [Clostridiaceae bacterium]